MTDSTTSNVPTPRARLSVSEMIESRSGRRNRLIRLWNALTAIPEVSPKETLAQREAARQSRLTSNVLFFFTVMVVALLPACFFAPGHAYFWLDLELAVASILALALNRRGYTLAAGILVSLAGFLTLTVALFTSVPFDETTLQGYDMYVIVELLAVSLLPIRSIFLTAIMSTIAIIGTLIYVPHTAVLDKDLHERLPIIIARPVGTLFLVAGVAYILASTMTTAIKRAGRAELIAHLQHEIAEQEHLLAEQKHELDAGIQQILQTHVAVANGHLNARAPLSQDNMLWQIASALNTLLVRFQRAAQAEADLWRIEQAVTGYVNSLQQAEQNHEKPLLPLSHTRIDPLIMALQSKTFNTIQLPQIPSTGKLLPPQRRIAPRE
ncbi:MAG: hypothetical protein M3Z08_10040 [Chloroflexota bacterium]|nr:hypothetical protein [Chloroflexota bacterium]